MSGLQSLTLWRILHVMFFLLVGCVLLAFVNECSELLMEDALSAEQRLMLFFTIFLGVANCVTAVTTERSRFEFLLLRDVTLVGNLLFGVVLILCALFYADAWHPDSLPAWTLRGFGGGFASDGALFGMFVFGCAFMILLARASIYPWPIHWYWSIRSPKPPKRAEQKLLAKEASSGNLPTNGAKTPDELSSGDALKRAMKDSALEYEAERLRRSLRPDAKKDEALVSRESVPSPNTSRRRSRAASVIQTGTLHVMGGPLTSSGPRRQSVVTTNSPLQQLNANINVNTAASMSSPTQATGVAPLEQAVAEPLDQDEDGYAHELNNLLQYVAYGDEDADDARSVVLMLSGVVIMAAISYSLHLNRLFRCVMLVIGICHLLQVYGQRGRGASVLLLMGLLLSICIIVFGLAFGRKSLPAGGLLLWVIYGLTLLYMERLLFSKLERGWAKRTVRSIRTALQL